MAARKAGQGSKWLAASTRHAIYARDGHACAWCGATEAEGARLSVDHVLACNNGGTNAVTNLVTACLACNSAKQDLSTRGWLAYLRAAGADTTGVADRVRRLVAKPLDRAEGRKLAAAAKAARKAAKAA